MTIESAFPKLTKDNYSISSPETPEYNCIAWAICDTEKWWWPDANDIYYWPINAPREETLKAFIAAYETLGYTIYHNAEYEEGFEKIAIYVDSNGKPTHAARQLESGDWTSKLGQSEDIKHKTLSLLEGYSYGTVTVILKRPQKTIYKN